MFNKERFEQLNNKINYKSSQSTIAMSNKYFRILNQLVNSKKLKKGHVAYTYSYLYLITYLFRFTKYEDVVLNVKEIKELLGYAPNNKVIDYITKQDGLLDSEGLTMTLFDFPVIHTIDETGELEFTMLSDFNDTNGYGTTWRRLHGINFNQSCKYPVLGFHSGIVEEVEFTLNNLGGTFYNSEDTTIIPFDVFAYCMSHEGLGCTGFYLYCFISFRNSMEGNCKMSISDLAKNCNMSIQTCQTYMNTLRQYNLIRTVVADKFVFGEGQKGSVESNTHFSNPFDDFVKDEMTIKLVKPNYVHVSKIEKCKQTLDTIDFFWS